MAVRFSPLDESAIIPSMDADYSVELGPDDPSLEMPWSDPDGRLHYHDLRRQPEALLLIDEAAQYRELGEFLVAVNSSNSVLESAKCDVWTDDVLEEAEEIYGAATKFASYVDLLFNAEGTRFDFALHEAFARRAVELLGRAPEVSSAAEFVIRRCYYKGSAEGTDGDPAAGYYFTFHLTGYGDDEQDARQRWGTGLALAQNALLQMASEFARQQGSEPAR